MTTDAKSGPSVAELMTLVDAYADTAAVNGIRSQWAQMARGKVELALKQLPAPQAQADAQDAAFEAVRKKFCKLQRYSFFLDDKGNVRRVPQFSGNWVEFESVHTLFDPASVDAAIAAAKGE